MRTGWSVRRSGALCAALGLSLPVVANAMTVETFLAKAKVLQARGLSGAASADLPLIRAEVKAAADAYRERQNAERIADLPPRSCPPPRGKAKIDATALIADFSALPLAQRSQSVSTAFGAVMARRYPCGR